MTSGFDNMVRDKIELEDLGWDSWFSERVDTSKLDDYQVARVIAVHKDNYILKNDKHEVLAEITGKFIFGIDSALDYPAVGDWVYAQYIDEDSFAVIHQLLPRKSLLKRKTAGKKIDFQLIAANVDIAFVMQSVDSNYNIRRLERYLAMIYEANSCPVVLLSKSDLLSETALVEKIGELRKVIPDTKIIAFSNVDGTGLDQLENFLTPGQTFCLLGSSGVGKTTLLNKLLDEDLYKTQEVRKGDSKGKHTTSSRQLTILKNGAMLIDTPGMREFGNFGVESGIDETFAEISELTHRCRYSDCSHSHEAGCAVLAALEEGEISYERYNNYVKLLKESAHYQRSYVEKRQRDKALGKFYKSVLKENIKNR